MNIINFVGKYHLFTTQPPPASLFTQPPPAPLFTQPPPAIVYTENPPASLLTQSPPASLFTQPPPATLFTQPPPASLFTLHCEYIYLRFRVSFRWGWTSSPQHSFFRRGDEEYWSSILTSGCLSWRQAHVWDAI